MHDLVPLLEKVMASGKPLLIIAEDKMCIRDSEWAERAGTISWEILCGIGARVPRILVD